MTIKHLVPIALAIGACITIFLLSSKSASAPNPSPTPTPIVCVDDIQCFAIDYGISEVQLRSTLKCESGFKHEGLFGDGGDAYGIAQFHFRTFYGYRKLAIEQGYPFENFQYENREDQLELMSWAFLNGKQRAWTCWTRLFAK